MDKAKVKDAILKAAGYPESGVIKDLADSMAQAVLDIDKQEVKKFEPIKESRIQEVKESR